MYWVFDFLKNHGYMNFKNRPDNHPGSLFLYLITDQHWYKILCIGPLNVHTYTVAGFELSSSTLNPALINYKAVYPNKRCPFISNCETKELEFWKYPELASSLIVVFWNAWNPTVLWKKSKNHTTLVRTLKGSLFWEHSGTVLLAAWPMAEL